MDLRNEAEDSLKRQVIQIFFKQTNHVSHCSKHALVPIDQEVVPQSQDLWGHLVICLELEGVTHESDEPRR